MKKGLKQSTSKKNTPLSSNSKDKGKKENVFIDYVKPKPSVSTTRINRYDVIFGYWKEFNEYMKNIKEEDFNELKNLEEESILGFKQFVMNNFENIDSNNDLIPIKRKCEYLIGGEIIRSSYCPPPSLILSEFELRNNKFIQYNEINLLKEISSIGGSDEYLWERLQENLINKKNNSNGKNHKSNSNISLNHSIDNNVNNEQDQNNEEDNNNNITSSSPIAIISNEYNTTPNQTLNTTFNSIESKFELSDEMKNKLFNKKNDNFSSLENSLDISIHNSNIIMNLNSHIDMKSCNKPLEQVIDSNIDMNLTNNDVCIMLNSSTCTNIQTNSPDISFTQPNGMHYEALLDVNSINKIQILNNEVYNNVEDVTHIKINNNKIYENQIKIPSKESVGCMNGTSDSHNINEISILDDSIISNMSVDFNDMSNNDVYVDEDEINTDDEIDDDNDGDNNNNDNNNQNNTTNNSFQSSQQLILDSWDKISHLFQNNSGANNLHYNKSNKIYSGNYPGISTQLGKRGRYYKDIWDEEDYLNLNSNETLDCIDVINDFSDLIHSYSDNHDGSYRSWLIQQINPTSRRHRIKENKRKLYNNDINNDEDDEDKVLLVTPPVPSSIQHPASWSLTTKNSTKLYNSRGKSYENIHPAWIPNRNLLPPGLPCDIYEYDDYDELNLYIEDSSRQLEIIEARNYINLNKLKNNVNNKLVLEKLKMKRMKIDEMILASIKINESKHIISNNSIYSNLLNNDNNNNNNDNTSIMQSILNENNSSHKDFVVTDNNQASYNNLTSNIINNKINNSIISSIPIPHSDFINNLKIGNITELLLNNRWCLGVVIGIKFDDNILLRYFKIQPLGSCVWEAVWINFEDCRLAPIGKNLMESLCLSLLKIHFKYDMERMNDIKFNDLFKNNKL